MRLGEKDDTLCLNMKNTRFLTVIVIINFLVTIAIIGAAILFLIKGSGNQKSTTPILDTTPSLDVPFTTIYRSYYLDAFDKTDPEYTAVQSQKELNKILQEYKIKNFDSNLVDFSKDTLLFAFIGSRTTGGFDVNFEEIRDTGSILLAYIVEERHGEHCLVTQAVTYPIRIVKIPKTDKKVQFIKRTKTYNCK